MAVALFSGSYLLVSFLATPDFIFAKVCGMADHFCITVYQVFTDNIFLCNWQM